MIYWIWLSKVPQIGCHISRALLKKFHDPEHIYYAEYEQLLQIKGIGPKRAKLIYNTKCLSQAEKIMKNCHKHKIKIMTINDDIYPKKAKMFDDMPIILYYKGPPNSDLINKKSAAIVGSRRCSRQARQTAIDLAVTLSDKGITIVSGMAKGIDSYAQTACLKNEGYTIAVLGNGLDICYPIEHEKLMDQIEKNGMLLSEYEPGIKPQKVYFPRRNRIIAALSDEIIVVEAKKGSGALITAQYGENYHRKVIRLM